MWRISRHTVWNPCQTVATVIGSIGVLGWLPEALLI
jgi:hypothetical protein